MWPFTGRAQFPIPLDAKRILAEIPKDFKDDGCSNSLDSLFGFTFKWACRVHDWRYCTRCHAAGSMTYASKNVGDQELKQNMRASLPFRWRWVRYGYKAAVVTFGGFGAYDTCGQSAGTVCRHGQLQPDWMRAL